MSTSTSLSLNELLRELKRQVLEEVRAELLEQEGKKTNTRQKRVLTEEEVGRLRKAVQAGRRIPYITYRALTKGAVSGEVFLTSPRAIRELDQWLRDNP